MPSVAADGNLLMVHGLIGTQREIVRVNASGEIQWTSGHVEWEVSSPALSPDGRRIAASADGDIWIYDLEQGTRTQMTLTPNFETTPAWSPSGERLAYSIIDMNRLALISSSGGQAQMLVEGVEPEWTLDGQALVYANRNPADGSYGFYRLPVESDLPEEVTEVGVVTLHGRSTVHEVTTPRLSPSGKLLAYSSDESGRVEI